MIRAATALIGLLLSAEFGSETIDVKGRGAVDLSPFECRDINRSSFIQRVCYDQAKRYLIIGIKGVYDQYCELPQPAFDGLMGAPSMGQFFNQHIGGSGAEGRYGCRPHPIPGVSHRQDRADGFLTALVFLQNHAIGSRPADTGCVALAHQRSDRRFQCPEFGQLAPQSDQVSVSPIAGLGAGFAILHQRQQRAYLFD